MNILLLFFALPVATIILSIVLLKILKCPVLVAATFFAIYLVLAYTVFGNDFLIFVIVYTILSYITAVLTRLICNIINKVNRCFYNGREGNNQDCCNSVTSIARNNQGDCLSLTSRANNNQNDCWNSVVATSTNQNGTLSLANNINSNRNNNSSRRNCCCCGRR